MSKKAMKLALEALQKIYIAPEHEDYIKVWWPACEQAITALREALAEQLAQQQEPVAWMHVMDNTEGIKANGKGHISITQKRKHPFGKPGVDFSKSYPVTSTPLYTSPSAQRTWVGLTDEERIMCRSYDPEEAVAKTEAKLKEKNT